MKRLASSDSLGALMSSICPNSTDDQENCAIGDLMLDEDVEECGRISEKKRRLRVDQVKALEKNFEVENKLEPEKKVKLAQELGLQPRQVAVWFQNRRARWKTKQLERDYGVLKANHDALKAKFETLQRENQSLLNQIDEVKSKMKEEGSIKEESLVEKGNLDENQELILGDMKSSDSSDSSAVVNSGVGVLDHHEFLDTTTILGQDSQTQLVKIEEYNFFDEDCCSSLFSDDEAPTLHWYCSHEWN